MPFKLRKAPKKDLYWVVDSDGKHYSKDPLPKERAEAQRRALYVAEGKSKMKGGMKANPLLSKQAPQSAPSPQRAGVPPQPSQDAALRNIASLINMGLEAWDDLSGKEKIQMTMDISKLAEYLKDERFDSFLLDLTRSIFAYPESKASWKAAKESLPKTGGVLPDVVASVLRHSGAFDDERMSPKDEMVEIGKELASLGFGVVRHTGAKAKRVDELLKRVSELKSQLKGKGNAQSKMSQLAHDDSDSEDSEVSQYDAVPDRVQLARLRIREWNDSEEKRDDDDFALTPDSVLDARDIVREHAEEMAQYPPTRSASPVGRGKHSALAKSVMKSEAAINEGKRLDTAYSKRVEELRKVPRNPVRVKEAIRVSKHIPAIQRDKDVFAVMNRVFDKEQPRIADMFEGYGLRGGMMTMRRDQLGRYLVMDGDRQISSHKTQKEALDSLNAALSGVSVNTKSKKKVLAAVPSDDEGFSEEVFNAFKDDVSPRERRRFRLEMANEQLRKALNGKGKAEEDVMNNPDLVRSILKKRSALKDFEKRRAEAIGKVMRLRQEQRDLRQEERNVVSEIRDLLQQQEEVGEVFNGSVQEERLHSLQEHRHGLLEELDSVERDIRKITDEFGFFRGGDLNSVGQSIADVGRNVILPGINEVVPGLGTVLQKTGDAITSLFTPQADIDAQNARAAADAASRARIAAENQYWAQQSATGNPYANLRLPRDATRSQVRDAVSMVAGFGKHRFRRFHEEEYIH